MTAPVVDRAVIEQVFCVGRRRAIELMHRFGGYQTGKTFLADRNSLLRQLEALEQGEAFGTERTRRRRIAEEVRGHAIPIPPPRPMPGMPGIHLRPGELRIEFKGTEDLLRRLLELALAIRNDYDRFDKLASSDAAER